MLSMEQYKIIDEQLSKENSTEVVKALIGKYANSVETVGELLSYIPQLTEKQLNIKQQRINQYSWGMDLMIGIGIHFLENIRKMMYREGFLHYFLLVRHIL